MFRKELVSKKLVLDWPSSKHIHMNKLSNRTMIQIWITNNWTCHRTLIYQVLVMKVRTLARMTKIYQNSFLLINYCNRTRKTTLTWKWIKNFLLTQIIASSHLIRMYQSFWEIRNLIKIQSLIKMWHHSSARTTATSLKSSNKCWYLVLKGLN